MILPVLQSSDWMFCELLPSFPLFFLHLQWLLGTSSSILNSGAPAATSISVHYHFVNFGPKILSSQNDNNPSIGTPSWLHANVHLCRFMSTNQIKSNCICISQKHKLHIVSFDFHKRYRCDTLCP